MIEHKAAIYSLKDFDEVKANLKYWLSRTPAERIAAMEVLWRQRHGELQPIKRVARIIRLRKKAK